MSNIPATNVPGFRAQATTVVSKVHSTLADAEKRAALAADVHKHAAELTTITKEHLTDAEKRSQLLAYAKTFASQALAAAKDPAQRQALLDKVTATAHTVQEAINDPAKRKEVHDELAAVTYKLLVLPLTDEDHDDAAPTPQK